MPPDMALFFVKLCMKEADGETGESLPHTSWQYMLQVNDLFLI